MKRNWFFLTEKLQITPAERTAVTTLIAMMVILHSIPATWFGSDPFDQEYYAPVLAEFEERLRLREAEREQTLARFYPPREPVADSPEDDARVEMVLVSAEEKAVGKSGDQTGAEGENESTKSGNPPLMLSTERTGENILPELTYHVREANAANKTHGASTTHSGSTALTGSTEHTGSTLQTASTTHAANTDTMKTKGDKAPDSVKININTATISDLQQLPGIGPSIASRIVEFRIQNGPFRTVDEITGVRGIGEARLNSLRDLITVR